jgi:hypothetical protein
VLFSGLINHLSKFLKVLTITFLLLACSGAAVLWGVLSGSFERFADAGEPEPASWQSKD